MEDLDRQPVIPAEPRRYGTSHIQFPRGMFVQIGNVNLAHLLVAGLQDPFDQSGSIEPVVAESLLRRTARRPPFHAESFETSVCQRI
jgi:hypothetical protein